MFVYSVQKSRFFSGKNMQTRNDIRNIALIAHVDHGKTTLVDQMLRQSGVFRANQQMTERVMDSNDLERERGITILAKNTAVRYGDTTINIIDTPGHADFGGEVERILTMVDGVLLLVDAFEGCMPQTRFVMRKALGMNKTAVVVVNKIDRPDARPNEVVDGIIEMFFELGANNEQIDFPVVYTSGKDGYAYLEGGLNRKDITPLFETILEHIPAPMGDMEGPFQVLFSNIEYDEYVGRIGIGRVERGSVSAGQNAVLCKKNGSTQPVRMSRLYKFEGLKRVDVQHAALGDIIAVAGIEGISIGETACDPDCIEPLPFVDIDEPTVSMMFMVNDSPFTGREGRYVTSRNLRERLFKEVESNVSLRVEETDSSDAFKVSGRGELHLGILIETMRREDYEFQVSRPHVILKKVEGVDYEPMERLMVDVREAYVGVVMEKLGGRNAELVTMQPDAQGGVRLEFSIPVRMLMGYRSEFLTDTKGNGIMSHVFDGYEPCKGNAPVRARGSIIAHETGVTTGYALFGAQDRGRLFVGPGVEVYEGMVVGENARAEDIVVNVCKKKHVTNMRASGSDESLRLTPPVLLSLEQTMEFIADDELMEVTPKSIRMRKRILNKERRYKNGKWK